MLDLLPFCGLKRDFQSFLPKNACKHIEKDTKWSSFILENYESNNDHGVRVNKKTATSSFLCINRRFSLKKTEKHVFENEIIILEHVVLSQE